MTRVRPCIACGKPLDMDGDCATVNCAYNPDSDMKEHDAEFEYVEGVGDDTAEDVESFDIGPEMSDAELAELLDDSEDSDYKGEMPEVEQGEKPKDDKLDNKINQDAQDADDRMDMGGGDEGDMDTQDVEAEDQDEPELSQAEIDELANEGKGEKPEPDTEKQLTEEDLGEDPSDDAMNLEDEQDEKDGLPPRPRGCNGDCQPGDQYDDDAEPCPHCTAKGFREEMKAEGKENLPEEEMETEWQNFLDNWEDEAGSGGDEGDADTEGIDDLSDLEDQMQQEKDEDRISQEGEGGTPDDDAPEDWEPDLNTDDLPPRPQGCSGNCADNEDPDGDGEPCPHCTAKSFKDEMRQEQEQNEQEFDAEELAKRFQDMLQDRRDNIENKKWLDEQLENQEGEGDKEEDELCPHGFPHELCGNCHEDEAESEPESSERDELISRVNAARHDFTVDVFIDLAAMSDEKLTGMFSAEELSDFGDVAENNNAHKAAGRLRALAEKMNEPPEDELEDDAPDESDEDREQNNNDPDAEDDGGSEKLGEGEQEDKPDEEGFKRKGKDLTITQEKRFDNIVNRIAKKVEGTFGQTAEDMFTMPKSDGQFQGEDLSQAIQITSRGVIYWVTISAAKDIDLG